MRVISLVPSLTETLLYCGVEVVGRTRFCIHPEAQVKSIPVVGGTKEVSWDRCAELSPDLVIFDREENTREMADACPFNWVATHITSLADVATAMSMLAEATENRELDKLAAQWSTLAETPLQTLSLLDDLPGIIRTIGSVNSESVEGYERVEYLIWREPWMAVAKDTFIGSVLQHLGLGSSIPDYDARYPELKEPVPRHDTFYILSSEPYPFERYADELETMGFNGVLVDGELYSWFGVRSYTLLKQYFESRLSGEKQ